MPKQVPDRIEADPGILVRVADGVQAEESIVSSLSRVPANEDRLSKFAVIVNNPKTRIAGWHYIIKSINKEDDTTFATVRVIPIAKSPSGRYVTVGGYVDEQYRLENGNFIFVKQLRGSKLIYVLND